MQFSTALIFASSALAYSSVFETRTNQQTDSVTVTSCASTLTNCIPNHPRNITNFSTSSSINAAPLVGSYYAAGVAALAAGALLL
ncbi:unnamed protein product [Ambrosiozyma monospora]|uniref:Unnamed protein product n=1 Tax=Ambrosiozyma monospora TaxID=43982 RepID=A0A9W6WHK0_AMBMO|nr:unnamed protein product [Ambrosiozyma monospora]